MAAITNPGTADKDSYRVTEFPGEYKLLSFYNLALASASEALTLSYLDNGITSIQNTVVCVNAGQDAEFMEVASSFSGLVVTITSVGANGAASSAWTTTTCNLVVIGK